jgi:glucose-1-phosphate adenylyltransferase
MGVALDSIVAAGCIISGGRVIRSVLSPGVRVNSYCEVENSILLPYVEIGRHSRIRNAIICENVKIPDNSLIGYDPEQDKARGYAISEGGVVVVPSRPETYGTMAI